MTKNYDWNSRWIKKWQWFVTFEQVEARQYVYQPLSVTKDACRAHWPGASRWVVGNQLVGFSKEPLSFSAHSLSVLSHHQWRGHRRKQVMWLFEVLPSTIFACPILRCLKGLSCTRKLISSKHPWWPVSMFNSVQLCSSGPTHARLARWDLTT